MKCVMAYRRERRFFASLGASVVLLFTLSVAVFGQTAANLGRSAAERGSRANPSSAFAQPPPFTPNESFPPRPGATRLGTRLVQQFDQNADGWLNNAERKAAREFLSRQIGQRRPGGPGGPPPGRSGRENARSAPQAGAKLTPADVNNFPGAPLYASNVLRTIFLEFENADWERELADFKNTDVEVPAKVTVDGKSYPDVGVHFHGMSSYMMAGEGWKRSLTLTFDFIHDHQELGGYRKLDLLNSHEDPSFLRTVLAMQIARDYIPAPQANFVRVVINRESWGVYVNQQHFNKDFLRDWFGTTEGARWKVPGGPGGRGGFNYLGQDLAAYKRIYEIKSKERPQSWVVLINFCKVLKETPTNELEEALMPLLDIDSTLKFLAWDNVLANGDGFWTRASDYSLYLDVNGRFHLIPYDANETFNSGGGPGGPGGFRPRIGGTEPISSMTDKEGERLPPPGFGPAALAPPGGQGPGRLVRGGVELDPLVSINDAGKPLLSRLLAVPTLRARYLGYVHDIAEKWLDWNTLGPVAEQYHSLLADEVKADTRKLDSFEAFQASVSGGSDNRAVRGPSPRLGVKAFADQRRAFLLKQPEVTKAVARSKGAP